MDDSQGAELETSSERTIYDQDLEEFKVAVKQNPALLDSEDNLYDFVTRASAHSIIFDSERNTVKRQSGVRDLKPFIRAEMGAAQSFKAEMPTLANLVDTSPVDHGWIQLSSKGSDLNLGRIYISPRLDMGVNFIGLFKILAKYFNEHPDLLRTIKVYDFDTRGSWAFSGYETVINDLNRADILVLYFDMSKREDVIKYLQDLYNLQGEEVINIFDNKRPLFSEPVKDMHGDMKGISFAEDPRPLPDGGVLSRNRLIARVLNEASQEARGESFEENLAPSIKHGFEKYGINPSNPAYNLPLK